MRAHHLPKPSLRKIGGIHWFAIGRLRIAVCVCKRSATNIEPKPMRAHIEPSIPVDPYSLVLRQTEALRKVAKL